MTVLLTILAMIAAGIFAIGIYGLVIMARSFLATWRAGIRGNEPK